MKIGILSDTHNLLRQDVLEKLKCCDAIIHAGDFSRPDILSALRNIAPTYAVRGNNDKLWDNPLPDSITFKLAGFRFFVIHKRGDIRTLPEETDIVIYGHSHRYSEKKEKSVLYLNPGSCGPRRFDQACTFIILELQEEAHLIKITPVHIQT